MITLKDVNIMMLLKQFCFEHFCSLNVAYNCIVVTQFMEWHYVCRKLCLDGVTGKVVCMMMWVYECQKDCQKRASNNLIIDFVMLHMCIF